MAWDNKAYQKQRKKNLEKLGLCRTCGQFPVKKDRSRCIACGDKQSIHRSKMRKEANIKVICQSCNVPLTNGRRLCENCLVKSRKNKKKYRLDKRDTVIKHYSFADKSQCVCCGESEECFLTLDHINGGGNRENNGKRYVNTLLFRRLIEQNFPGGYQTLCCNCNFGRWRNGGICPHKELKCSES